MSIKFPKNTELEVPRSRVFALTGGIACGKSTVLRLLKEHGFLVLSADEVAREVVAPGQKGLELVISRFGPKLLRDDGTLDRKALGKRVFQNPSERKELEEILHPLIREHSSRRIQELRKTHPDSHIVYEVPLYFESGLKYPEIDGVITVFSPKELSLKRLMKRESLTETEASQRIAAQMDINEKAKRADYLIDNSGSEQDLTENVLGFLKLLSTNEG